MVIGIVFPDLANHTAYTAHDLYLVDIRVVSHEQRIPGVIKQLAVYKVVTWGANQKETVADELHVSAYVTKPPVSDLMNCKENRDVNS